MSLRRFLPALSCFAFFTATTLADNWPQWRGPHQNGASISAKNLPVRWSVTENVVWKVKLPSWSAATPIVWGDVVLITSAEEGFNDPLKYEPRGGGGPGARRGQGGSRAQGKRGGPGGGRRLPGK